MNDLNYICSQLRKFVQPHIREKINWFDLEKIQAQSCKNCHAQGVFSIVMGDLSDRIDKSLVRFFYVDGGQHNLQTNTPTHLFGNSEMVPSIAPHQHRQAISLLSFPNSEIWNVGLQADNPCAVEPHLASYFTYAPAILNGSGSFTVQENGDTRLWSTQIQRIPQKRCMRLTEQDTHTIAVDQTNSGAWWVIEDRKFKNENPQTLALSTPAYEALLDWAPEGFYQKLTLEELTSVLVKAEVLLHEDPLKKEDSFFKNLFPELFSSMKMRLKLVSVNTRPLNS